MTKKLFRDYSVPADIFSDSSVPADIVRDYSVPTDIFRDYNVPADMFNCLGITVFLRKFLVPVHQLLIFFDPAEIPILGAVGGDSFTWGGGGFKVGRSHTGEQQPLCNYSGCLVIRNLKNCRKLKFRENLGKIVP